MFEPNFKNSKMYSVTLQRVILKHFENDSVDRISSAVLWGVPHEGRLIGRGAWDQEQEGNRDTWVRHVQY